MRCPQQPTRAGRVAQAAFSDYRYVLQERVVGGAAPDLQPAHRSSAGPPNQSCLFNDRVGRTLLSDAFDFF
jgi:hypothetical protein